MSELGALGIAGVGLLLFTIVIYLASVAPMRAEVAAMQRSLAAAKEGGGRPVARPRVTDPLADFYDFFPPAESSAQWLATVYAVAEREHLNLPRGEYRLTSSGDNIARYEAVFALRGSYPQLRAFIAGVLEEIPIAALEDVRLEKQRSSDNTVDARLRLTFFLRNL